LGRIGAPWGVKGWVHIDSYTDPLEGILDYEQWVLRLGSGQRVTHVVAEGQPHADRLVARLEGIEDRDRAAALTGAVIEVDRAELPPTGEREYYQADLIQNHQDPEAIAVAQADALQCAAAEGVPAQAQQSVANSMYESAVAQMVRSGEVSTQFTVRRLDEIVRRISAMPGQRSMVFLSPGFITSTYEYDVLRIVDRSNMRARILVRDWEVQEIQVGQPVKIQVLARPYTSYEGHIEKILPAAALDQPVAQPFKLERQGQAIANYFAVEVLIPNPDGSLIEGMTGTAKISGERSSLAWQFGRGFWRWLRLQIW